MIQDAIDLLAVCLTLGLSCLCFLLIVGGSVLIAAKILHLLFSWLF